MADISMKSSVIPVQLHSVWVTPIWMRTVRELASEYRPISIINHCDYINIHNLISQDQHEGSSKGTTLTHLIDQHDTIMEALANVNDLKVIYFDFAKVFDLVDTSILLMKLKDMGFSGNLLKWIETFYLIDTKMCE